MFYVVHPLRCIRRFGSWPYSRLQVTGCHDGDIFNCFFIFVSFVAIGIEPELKPF